MRPLALLALAALLAGSGGCAASRAERARGARLTAELDRLRYSRPIDEVWLEVRRLLAERDYPLAAADARAVGQPEPKPGTRLFGVAMETAPIDAGLLPKLGMGAGGAPKGLALETGWRRSTDRYRAEAIEDGGGVRVVLTRLVDDGTDRIGKPVRDPALELELARRLDAEAAARIEAAAAAPAS
jgi:hypothetical protein